MPSPGLRKAPRDRVDEMCCPSVRFVGLMYNSLAAPQIHGFSLIMYACERRGELRRRTFSASALQWSLSPSTTKGRQANQRSMDCEDGSC